MRFIYFLVALPILALVYATDPDVGWIKLGEGFGMSTFTLILSLIVILVILPLAHYGRKALHPYPEADARSLFVKAREHPVGAGLALVALAIVVNGILGLFTGVARAQVPERALQHLPTLSVEINKNWPNTPMREYFGGLIEHESCITLRHSRCWSPTSRLKSSREEGAGLGQLTRAWHPDGRLRFDALTEMSNRHPALRELSWANIYNRPDLQLRAVVLKVRGDFAALSAVSDRMSRLHFADAAYNGGLGGVNKERRACGLRHGCDPQKWFGNVEHVCLKSRQPLYGGRSACDINRHHVKDVIFVRAPKYRNLV